MRVGLDWDDVGEHDGMWNDDGGGIEIEEVRKWV